MPVSTFYFRYSEQTVCHYESSRDPVFVLSASLRYRFIRSLTPPKRSSTHTASRGQQSLKASHICVFITSLTHNLLCLFFYEVLPFQCSKMFLLISLLYFNCHLYFIVLAVEDMFICQSCWKLHINM